MNRRSFFRNLIPAAGAGAIAATTTLAARETLGPPRPAHIDQFTWDGLSPAMRDILSTREAY